MDPEILPALIGAVAAASGAGLSSFIAQLFLKLAGSAKKRKNEDTYLVHLPGGRTEKLISSTGNALGVERELRTYLDLETEVARSLGRHFSGGVVAGSGPNAFDFNVHSEGKIIAVEVKSDLRQIEAKKIAREADRSGIEKVHVIVRSKRTPEKYREALGKVKFHFIKDLGEVDREVSAIAASR